MATTCNVCDGTSFTINAGFYYCDDCGNRITVLQEIEALEDGVDPFNATTRIEKIKIKQPSKSDNKNELTSWEIHNYVLYGLTNELVCLGCKDELPLVTLQLWSYYLHRHEIAFFGKRDTKLPKMPLTFRKRDYRLVYNVKLPKRKRTQSKSSVSTGSMLSQMRRQKLQLSRNKRSLANAEYEDYLSSQKSDISSIGYNLSQPSSTAASSCDDSDQSVRLEYSRNARCRAKRLMTRDHLHLHQNTEGKRLKCHKKADTDMVGRRFVFAIIWLALNHVGDDLQLADLLRYGNESHIKTNNISHLVPTNVNAQFAVNMFRQSGGGDLHHFGLRQKAYAIARTVRFRNAKLPDFGRLCERYCVDLSLPPIVAQMAKKLIAFYPPQMKLSLRSMHNGAMPNYEGRAMAFIVFILKLIFGLDDWREHKMSESAKRLNEKMATMDVKHDQIFVWSEWRRYIDMRNHILAQCHYPTATQLEQSSRIPVDLYVDYLRRANEENMCTENYRRSQIENLRVIFEHVIKLHKEHDDRPNLARQFPPSLTPFASYFTQVLTDEEFIQRVTIPDYMHTRHDNRDLLCYVKPSKLRRAFDESGNYLHIFQIGHNPNVKFSTIVVDTLGVRENVRLAFNVTREEWLTERQQREKERAEENEKQQKVFEECARETAAFHIDRLQVKGKKAAKEKLTVIKAQTSTTTSTSTTTKSANTDDHRDVISDTISDIPSYKYFDEENKDIVDDFVLNAPRRNLDEGPNILDYASDSDADVSSDDETPLSSLQGDSHIEFLVNNFNYWISMDNSYHLKKNSFQPKLKKMPQSFQWLLNQCAMHVQMNPKDLYIELLAIESQYRYCLKPTFKMENCLRFRNIKKLSPTLQICVKQLDRIW